MKMLRHALTTLLCCLALAGAAGAQTRPPRNYEDRGACPFECCQYGEWTARDEAVFYKTRSTGARVAFRALKGERVTALTGVVVTLEPGRVVATGDMSVGGNGGPSVRVRKGAVMYLLHPTGEGFYKIWFRGRIYEAQPETAEEHAGRPQRVADLPYIRLLSRPRTVWWIKARDGRGRTGWTRQDDRFDGMDACGG